MSRVHYAERGVSQRVSFVVCHSLCVAFIVCVIIVCRSLRVIHCVSFIVCVNIVCHCVTLGVMLVNVMTHLPKNYKRIDIVMGI